MHLLIKINIDRISGLSSLELQGITRAVSDKISFICIPKEHGAGRQCCKTCLIQCYFLRISLLLLARAGIYGIKLYNALRFSFVVCLAYWGTGISMVAVAQLVESRIVIPVVAGSSPVSHPIYSSPRLCFARLQHFHSRSAVVMQLFLSRLSHIGLAGFVATCFGFALGCVP